MKQFIYLVALLATFILQINAEKFSCEGRASGYYADVNTGCQVYHMCDGLGRQFSYSCPNTTLFQQRMLICDHWYMVNCSKSEVDYNANLLIGQRDKPFVEDSSEHPYHRTPRPDLLQQPHSPSNRDDEYRQGRAHQRLPSSLNLVGVATDDDSNDQRNRNYTTDRPQYFLPSHWSTQYGKYITSPLPPLQHHKFNTPNNSGISKASFEKNVNFKDVKNRDTINKPIPKPLPLPQNRNQNQNQQNQNKINSRVDENIPDSARQESVSPSSLALPPFVPSKQQKPTPLNPPQLPPLIPNIQNIPKPSIYYQPPKLSPPVLDTESSTMDPQSFYKLIPSKDLVPPPLVPLPIISTTTTTTTSPTTTPTTPSTEEPPLRLTIDTKQSDINISEKRWKELRQQFFIPEYEFPLETGNRPSYESGLSSFQVNVAPPIPEAFRRPPPQEQQSSRGVNPNCPKCDPAFLAPGTCKPCVMIR